MEGLFLFLISRFIALWSVIFLLDFSKILMFSVYLTKLSVVWLIPSTPEKEAQALLSDRAVICLHLSQPGSVRQGIFTDVQPHMSLQCGHLHGVEGTPCSTCLPPALWCHQICNLSWGIIWFHYPWTWRVTVEAMFDLLLVGWLIGWMSGWMVVWVVSWLTDWLAG
jgi:hypothetical protein